MSPLKLHMTRKNIFSTWRVKSEVEPQKTRLLYSNDYTVKLTIIHTLKINAFCSDPLLDQEIRLCVVCRDNVIKNRTPLIVAKTAAEGLDFLLSKRCLWFHGAQFYHLKYSLVLQNLFPWQVKHFGYDCVTDSNSSCLRILRISCKSQKTLKLLLTLSALNFIKYSFRSKCRPFR